MKRFVVAIASMLAATAATAGTFKGVGGKKIAYAEFDEEVQGPGIVMLPGYTESFAFYEDLIDDFRGAGYSVYIMDHRGMGRSERLADNPQKVHVDRFEDYVTDALTFVNDVVPKTARPLHLFAHSTGGLIALNVVARQPDLFDSIVLSAPLIKMRFGALPGPLARLIVNLADKAGFGESYVFGRADVDVDQFKFADSQTTHDEGNFNARMDLFRADPALLMAGPTNRWVAEAIRATDHVAELTSKVTPPTLVLQAGDDRFVDNDAQADFCKAAPNCRLEAFPESFHEIFTEREAVRAKALAAALTHWQRTGQP